MAQMKELLSICKNMEIRLNNKIYKSLNNLKALYKIKSFFQLRYWHEIPTNIFNIDACL